MRRTMGAAIVLLGCSSCGSQPQARSATLPHLSCLSPDSTLAYGTIEVDSGETGDASGIQFTFGVRGDSLEGFVRDARGETPPAVPLKDVRVYAMGDSLSFWYGDRTRYFRRYQFRCDGLSGTARRFVTGSSAGEIAPDTLRRAVPITSP